MNDKKNKGKTGSENTGIETSKTEKQVVKSQQNVSKDLTESLIKTPREKADEAAKILNEVFGAEYNLEKNEGIRTYHIVRKDIVLQLKGRPLIPVKGKIVLGEGQMIVTVQHDGSLNIRLNDSKGHPYYHAKNLSNEDLLAEIPVLKLFISDEKRLPSKTKFIKGTG